MTVTVLLFGHYRDYLPEGRLTLALPAGATVQEVAKALAAQDSRFTGLLNRVRVAVSAEFAAPDTVLEENAEVAFLPPMSGG